MVCSIKKLLFQKGRQCRLVIFLFFLSIQPLCAQQKNTVYYELAPRFGALIKSPRAKGKISDYRVGEITAAVGYQTMGESYWEQFFNYPKYGLRLGYIHYLDVHFGESVRINMFIQAPFFRNNRFSFDYSFGVGLAAFTKYYDKMKNINNDYVSTPLAANTELMLHLEYQLTSVLDVFGGGSFSHFSNGSTNMPNLGINDVLFFGGIRYHANQGSRLAFSEKIEKPVSLKNEIYTFFAPSFMKYRFEGGVKSFFGSTFEIGYRRQFHPCLKWGAGIDIMYNGHEMYSFDEDRRSKWKNISQAVFGSFEILFGDVSLHVGLGVCTLYSSKPRGVIYERAGVFYNFGKSKNQFAGVSIKANYGIAEYVEWTYGIKLKRF